MASPGLRPVLAPTFLLPSVAEKRKALVPSPGLEETWDGELGGMEQGNRSKSVDLSHVIKLLEEPEPSTTEEQLQVLEKVANRYRYGILLNDIAQISKILNLCAEKSHTDKVFIEPTCEIIKLYGLPFSKKKLSDEVTYAKEVQEAISQLGCLMRVPCSQVKIQICKSIINFYHAEPPKKEFQVYQPVSANYKKHMVELGGLAETLVLSLTLVENQLTEKLWIIKTLQHLSISETNCQLMMKAQAPIRLCSHLNDVDPTGQLLFRSSEVLWNLLENTSKDEITDQFNNLECVQALKEAFTHLLLHGSRHYDRQLRNDILVIATLVAQIPGTPMIETGFAKQLILFATFHEVKSHNPLVKGLRITSSYEDFELKKLLLNMLTVLAKDLCSVQSGPVGMSAAQFEELQLLAIATLATVAPLLIEDYMTNCGNTRLLMFLEWCLSNEPFFAQGNSFHGTGGRGTKLAQMRYCLKVLNRVVSLCDGTVNLDLCDNGAIQQLLDILKKTTRKYEEDAIVLEIQTYVFLILSNLCENDTHRKELFGWDGIDILIPFLKMDAKKLYSGLGHNRLLVSALDCLWCCVLGCIILEDYFLENEGIFTLLDLLMLHQKSVCNLVLGLLVEFCDNPKTVSHINAWQGKKGQTAANMLISLWRQEEDDMGVKRDKDGRIVDTKQPLIGQFQKTQEVIPMPANCPTIAIMDVAENMRAKIYCIICKLGFENLPGLTAKDFVTLAIIRRYLDFKVGEVWSEICAELKKENFRPVPPYPEVLQITEAFENVGKMVLSLQTEMLESQKYQELQEEEKCYAKIQSLHKQREMVSKSWENFLTRTSNYEALKNAKGLQEKSIEISRSKVKPFKATLHPTDIKGLNTTIASGRLVTVESTPSELTGGPLADTDLALKRLPIRGGALKRIKEVKVIDSVKKGSESIK
ncbi:cilia- and flagella-associated protein 69 isoform X2 [Anolis carolinensis]|uniref:cilia- and flagella-associated protein 69 isoform X2 n=1 Tax=Anolis carolinensis TaxID=28377 RepID=UPI000462D778|nr:PREDICTED: cilia- and flagella-associated protein 69 isoform X2 [Anolis carolinensis]|eukprot:XP_008110703.1 PREDICTED: cilia- and flagella-associated protein 69 isoform X2 [Anolis carolinensis]